MSYSSRVYRQRNPKAQDEAKDKPFFSKQNQEQPGKRNKSFFQAKPRINKAGDAFEKEADSIANSVVNRGQVNGAAQRKEISSVQRLATTNEEEIAGSNDQRMERDKEKPFQKKSAEPEKEKEKPVQKKDDPMKEKEKPVQKKDDPMKEKEKPVQKKDDPMKEKEKPVQKKEAGVEKPKEKEKELQVRKMENPKKDEENPSNAVQRKPLGSIPAGSPSSLIPAGHREKITSSRQDMAGMSIQRFGPGDLCPDDNQVIDDGTVQKHIDSALARTKPNPGQPSNLENAWHVVQSQREQHCCDVNLAAAEHYLYARHLVADSWEPFALVVAFILNYDSWGKYVVPKTGDCPITRPSTGLMRWGMNGATDGMADFYYPRP